MQAKSISDGDGNCEDSWHLLSLLTEMGSFGKLVYKCLPREKEKGSYRCAKRDIYIQSFGKGQPILTG